MNSLKELDSRYRVAEAARRVNEATYSHIDGRDLLAEIHPRHHTDIVVRRDGQDRRYEADWLSGLYDAILKLRAQLNGYDPEKDAMRERQSQEGVSQHVPAPTGDCEP